MLTTDADDALVVLVGNMKGNRGGHFLLHKIKTIFGGVILSSAYVDVKVVFVEAVEYDLYVA